MFGLQVNLHFLGSSWEPTAQGPDPFILGRNARNGSNVQPVAVWLDGHVSEVCLVVLWFWELLFPLTWSW